MDVTFSNSGAINRAHYALAQKVEAATDPGLADEAIIQEIDAIRKRFLASKFDVAACGEWLLVLLYCSTALSFGLPKPDYLEFALSAAVRLSEGGLTFQERRIGYLFCTQVMPLGHALGLMLVNTLRKDLESAEEPRICLALDVLTQLPSPEVIPAIRHRLEDLLIHHSMGVKRRVLHVFKVLSHEDVTILDNLAKKLKIRLKDRNVASVALVLSVDLVRVKLLTTAEILSPIIQLVQRCARPSAKSPQLLLQGVRALGQLGSLDENARKESDPLTIIMETLNLSVNSSPPRYAVALECFRGISLFPLSVVKEWLLSHASTHRHPVASIQEWLVSPTVNIQYVFLSCIATIDASLWAGTDEDISAQLNESQVVSIMCLLESNDSSIRRITSHVIRSVDPALLEAHLSHYVASIPSPYRHSLLRSEHYACRALEISELLDSEGSTYSSRVSEILQAVQMPLGVNDRVIHDDMAHLQAAQQAGWGDGAKAVLDGPVEMVLVHLRQENEAFRTTFTNDMSHSVLLGEGERAPTLVLIAAAVVSEYGDRLVIPQEDVLTGLNGCLKTASAALREPLLLAMLRTAARCDQISKEITSSIQALAALSGRHIRSRCDLFLTLTKDLKVLKSIAESARSSALPDFLEAVEDNRVKSASKRKSATSKPPGSPPLSPSQRPSHALRYDAYQAPHNIHSRGKQEPPPSTRSSKIPSERPDRSVAEGEAELEIRSPGLLAANADKEHLGRDIQTDPTQIGPFSVNSVISRIDLITLESPFHAEPPGSIEAVPSPNDNQDGGAYVVFHDQFTKAWSTLGSTSRGWCDLSPQKVAKELENSGLGFMVNSVQDLLIEGTPGEILALLPATSPSSDTNEAVAVLRLKPGDDGSCLWVLKCDDASTRGAIRSVLQRD